MAEIKSGGVVGELKRNVTTPKGHVAGKIAENIGTGENAKNSIVWMTITWSFMIAGVMSLLLFSLVVAEKNFKYLEEIKSVWSIFIPLITLALGYAFGKSK
jgi:uncharacterized integral membrane protein